MKIPILGKIAGAVFWLILFVVTIRLFGTWAFWLLWIPLLFMWLADIDEKDPTL